MRVSTNNADLTRGNAMVPGLVVIALIALLGMGVVWYQQQGQEVPTQSLSDEVATPTLSMNPQADVVNGQEQVELQGDWEDGTYEAVGTYTSPGGAETIGVVMTLEDGVITDAAVEVQAERPNSVRFQGLFADGFQQLVVGKRIEEVELDKVGGSSLTPIGFNDAVEQIKAQAQG